MACMSMKVWNNFCPASNTFFEKSNFCPLTNKHGTAEVKNRGTFLSAVYDLL